MSAPDEDIPSLLEVLRRESPWRSPLLGIAVAFTAGVVLDRYGGIAFGFSLLAAGCALLAFVVAHLGGKARLALVYLGLAFVSLGAAHHHFRHLMADDDIGHLASRKPTPIRLVGVLEEEPRRMSGDADSGPSSLLRSRPRSASATTILSVRAVYEDGRRRPASGSVRLVIAGAGALQGTHAGDEIDVRGQLLAIDPPANPGEFDTRLYWADRGVHAVVRVKEEDESVTRVRIGWHLSPAGWMGRTREAGHRLLDERLADHAGARGLARALLLGEGAPMTPDEWAKYVRTGVIHVLAISGQHLVVVAAFLWAIARLFRVRPRSAAVFVTLVLIGYALLTGGRPPAMRAAVGAAVVCGGILLRRPILPANLLAAAWIVVVLLQPSDALDPGTQLSFSCVAVLAWVIPAVLTRPKDEMERLIDSTRSAREKFVRWAWGLFRDSYILTGVIWLAITPLVACHTGLIAPAGLLLGPPLGFLTSVALLFGFALLLIGGWAGPFAVPLVHVVAWCLLACEWLVDRADAAGLHLPIGVFPSWLAMLSCAGLWLLFVEPRLRPSRRWLLPGGLAWLCLALVALPGAKATGELRCTFLAVGHGSCVVLILPDGRVVLHDAGSLRGPDVAARIIAPYLWSQGIRRIDDVILSHADLDHFNGLGGILERFPVGRVLLSETFARKDNVPVRATLDLCERYRVPVVAVHRGDTFDLDAVRLTVLHPPPDFRGANENARSVVVEVRHAGNTILLTGDLEGEGLAELLRQSPRPADVMQAPHHGSHTLNARPLLQWAAPRLAVSGQGPSRRAGEGPTPYEEKGVRLWTTHDHGAVTLTSRAGSLTAQTFSTRLVRDLSDPGSPLGGIE